MNKTIVVTGGSKGIGKSIVFKFAKNGFDIITCSRNAKELYSLESNLKSIYSEINLFTLKADLSNKDDCNKFIRFVNKKTKSIDVLVNNVGAFVPGKLISEDDSALKFMIDTNLYSNYWVTRGLVKIFTNQKYKVVEIQCSFYNFYKVICT